MKTVILADGRGTRLAEPRRRRAAETVASVGARFVELRGAADIGVRHAVALHDAEKPNASRG